MHSTDTIVAQATPREEAVLVSYAFLALKRSLWHKTVLGKLPKPRYADYLPFRKMMTTQYLIRYRPFSSLIRTHYG